MSTTPPPPPRRKIARSLLDLMARYDREVYDVVIVGSGYGGSMAAHALTHDWSGPPLRICVLERGREFLPGEFPSTLGEVPAQVRTADQNSGKVRGHEGLFDVRIGDDVAALVANGLGGGSLINAGVMLEPETADLDHPEFRTVMQNPHMKQHFARARRLLGAEVHRGGEWVKNDIERVGSRLPKTQALRSLDQTKDVDLVPITVALDNQADPNVNPSDVQMQACNHCGDCATGCNVGAKQSLEANLLAKAHAKGCEIYTGASVFALERVPKQPNPEPSRDAQYPERPGPSKRGQSAEAHWHLRIAHTDTRLQAREAQPFSIFAHRVILAAGTLGSPEILMRSRNDRLVFSQRLGMGFSCNGDNIVALHRLDKDVNGCADEDVPSDQRCVGPTITASARIGSGPGYKPFQLQDFSVPGPLKRVFDELVTTGHMLATLNTADPGPHSADQPDPLAVDPLAMRRTLLAGVIGHDDAAGVLRMTRSHRPLRTTPQMGTLRIHWPEARHGKQLDAADKEVRRIVAGSGQTDAALVSNPMWRLLPEGLERLVSQPRGPVLTVHPLGGCGMGTSVATGVVDEHGRVFDAAPDGRDAWEGSLLVLDGSVVPCSLGANPALTISALSLYAMAHWRAHWTFAARTARAPRAWAEPQPLLQRSVPEKPPHQDTRIEVIERLAGEVAVQSFPQGCIVELTLCYQPTSVQDLIGAERRFVELVSAKSYLRVFDKPTWDRRHLCAENDAARAQYAVCKLPLEGTLRFLHRETSSAAERRKRARCAWFANRGWRDIWQEFVVPRLPGHAEAAAKRPVGPQLGVFSDICRRIRDMQALASHAGEVRRFDYVLKIGEILKPPHKPFPGLVPGAPVLGHKRITYNRRANPWHQLTRLQLTAFPELLPGRNELQLDLRFLANQGVPLLRITDQVNQVRALSELASFGLYMARVLISTHLWTFRKPDTPISREPERLPGIIGGLPEPEVTELVVDRWPKDSPRRDEPLVIKLTRYPQDARAMRDPANDPFPLVMVHGYSVSGNTFTHPSIKPSAAEYFWHAGRDVWIVELRTSTGLDSATHPWSMEQAALIDLPAALLHVHHVTGRKVDVLAHCIGCVMFSMALLTDATQVRQGQVQLGTDTWLTDTHLGILKAFNGTHPQGKEHPVVRRAVLSQKGPVLRYTDANILRAFLFQSIRRLLLDDDYQFRASKQPKVMEQLLDRLLASLPYPDADYDAENPRLPWATTPWTTTRHRMDALYGRDFNAPSMRPETLDAIDDLFGAINPDTVAQTIHFARFNAITSQHGRGEFVTRSHLRNRWGGIPTLAIHGSDNGLVSVHTQVLLKNAMGRRAGVPLTVKTYAGLGHQDVLIGTRTKEVFEDVRRFLDDTTPPLPMPAPAVPGFVVMEAAWVGPRMEPAGCRRGSLHLCAMPRPDQGWAHLCLVPAWRQAAPRSGAPGFGVLQEPKHVAFSTPGFSSHWLRATPSMPLPTAQLPAGAETGWLALLVYWSDEVTARRTPNRQNPQPSDAHDARASDTPRPRPGRSLHLPPAELSNTRNQPLSPGEWGGHPAHPLSHGATPSDPTCTVQGPSTWPSSCDIQGAAVPSPTDVLEAAEQWIKDRPQAEVARSFVSEHDVTDRSELSRAESPVQQMTFAIGSCQYTAGLLDQHPANRSLQALSASTDRVSLALLLGDQIYADATAGIVDPVRRDELYQLPHDKALRQPGMRALMRRVPVHMLIDDHELCDNWEPLPPDASASKKSADDLMKVKRNGIDAFLLYQRMKNGAASRTAGGPLDLQFSWGGYPFLLLDTRTERERGAPSQTDTSAWKLFSCRQQEAFKAWLDQHKHAVKFVASSSLLFPRQTLTAGSANETAYSDAWDGFPKNLRWLIDHFVKEKIRDTVFLSGNEHRSMATEIWLGAGADRVKLLSVHSSALYAPYPFANGRQRDLQANETCQGATYGIPFEIQTHAPIVEQDGFAILQIDRPAAGAAANLTIEFNAPGGGQHPAIVLSLR